MGGSKSRSTIKTENNTLVVNRSDINILNKTVNEAVVNVVSKTNQSCANQVSLSNVIDFSGATISGDLNIGSGGENDCQVTLEQEGVFTFKCVNSSDLRNNVGSQIIDTVMQQLDQANSNDIVQKLENTADAKAKTGALSLGISSSNTNVSGINRYQQVNESKKNIQNIVRSSVESNFTNENVSNCVSKIEQMQGFDASGSLIGGNVNMCNFNSKQVSNAFVECLNVNEVSNKVINDAAKALDITIKEDVQTQQTAESTTTATATAEVQGVIDAIGNVLGSIGSAFLAPFLSPLSSICCFLCCCCIVVIIIMMMMSAGAGGTTPAYSSNFANSETSSDYNDMQDIYKDAIMDPSLMDNISDTSAIAETSF